MSIKDKAVSRIAAQLTALVGVENFRVICDGVEYGAYTDVKTGPKKKSFKVFDFKKDTDLYTRIPTLQPGESVIISVPGVPIATLQSAVSSISRKSFGPKNSITSRTKNGDVELLRLS
jgi:hypothetical protein